ncbi:hypothetical protein HHI36_016807 [Cryptolaemus montrouzieri]|uniref:Uncharacterized protein n=1 Tax=Cryptolaemus montrouzieri TaxID=559131 RepID=A0ABD2NL87_9CUCU
MATNRATGIVRFEDADDYSLALKEYRKKLKITILDENKEVWYKVLEEVNEDKWDLGYQIGTKPLGRTPYRMPNYKIGRMINALFPVDCKTRE